MAQPGLIYICTACGLHSTLDKVSIAACGAVMHSTRHFEGKLGGKKTGYRVTVVRKQHYAIYLQMLKICPGGKDLLMYTAAKSLSCFWTTDCGKEYFFISETRDLNPDRVRLMDPADFMDLNW